MRNIRQPKVAERRCVTMTNNQLKKLLVQARSEKGLTQEQVAVLTKKDISRQYYGMIENGERRPSVNVAKAIAGVLDINWTIFFEIKCNQKLRRRVV